MTTSRKKKRGSVVEVGTKPCNLGLWCQLAASINFSPFEKILTRPSFPEASLGDGDPPIRCVGPVFLFLIDGGLLRIHTAIMCNTKCRHSALVECSLLPYPRLCQCHHSRSRCGHRPPAASSKSRNATVMRAQIRPSFRKFCSQLLQKCHRRCAPCICLAAACSLCRQS